MAGKSHRVAARQSQLNRRRKKQQRGPSGIPVAGPGPAETASQEEEGSTTNVAVAAPQPVQTRSGRSYAPAAQEGPAASGRPRGLSREEAAPAYQYMGPEIRRILVMAGVAFAVLVILKFVL